MTFKHAGQSNSLREHRLPSAADEQQPLSVIRRLARKPAAVLRRVKLRRYLTRFIFGLMPTVRIPVRVGPGVWWLASNDDVGRAVLEGDFEQEERAFLRKFLLAGMVVFDVGAHHGLYTVLSARRIGSTGHVTSFEPQPDSIEVLKRQLRLNGLDNVQVESRAVGDRTGDALLFIAQDGAYSSLRRPEKSLRVRTEIAVPLVSLDDYVAARSFDHIDFMKLDVEGGELHALEGARNVLSHFKPVVLCEVHDVRTRQWGYPAQRILEFLMDQEFTLWIPRQDGTIVPLQDTPAPIAHNVVALPAERTAEIDRLAAKR